MMKYPLFVMLILLSACLVPAHQPKEKPISPTLPPEIAESPVVQPEFELPTRTVKQINSKGTIIYGLSEDNRLLHVQKDGEIWRFVYEQGKLSEIRGPENIEFMYNRSKLSSIDRGASKLQLSYDGRGRLVEVKGGQETLHLDYDSLDLIRAVRRGVAGKTSLDYDKKYKIKYVTRGLISTNVYYDDKNRVRNFDADDIKFILGYWRDDKLISLTGKTFGQGLAVSYGPDAYPTEAKITAEFDDSAFTAAYKESLYEVVDWYVYCKYVRRLPELLFDGISYTFYVNYFKEDIAGYISQQVACIPLQ